MAQRKLFLLAAAMFASWAMSPVQAAVPFMNLTVKVALEEPLCVLNNNKPIEVNFADVFIEKINQGIYNQPIIYDLDCKDKNMALTLTASGTSGFSAGTLETSRTGLAIAIQKDGQPLPVNTPVNFTLPDTPRLNAVLVKRGKARLDTGHFTATARMVVEYQ